MIARRFVILFVLAGLLGLAWTAYGQCVPRTDWPTYIVQRGDILSEIARRYGTTTTALAAANCLSNPDRIEVGQRLYVPGAAGSGSIRSVAVTYQPYENGFMIWRSDSGEIGVFVITAANSGTFTPYPAGAYSRLPDNPVRDTPPAGRIRPIFGFGKIWGNLPEVRRALGWATGAELGYSATINTQSLGITQITLPTGGVIAVNGGRLWSRVSGAVPQPILTPGVVLPSATPAGSTITTLGAYQPYESGFLLWRDDDETIYVFGNGRAPLIYPYAVYGSLPENPLNDPLPAGRVRPYRGFGRVWGNFADVRLAVGWATGIEQNFTLTVRTGSGSTCLNLPDGRRVAWSTGVWSVVAVCS